MTQPRSLRLGVATALFSVVFGATPTMAFQPSVLVTSFGPASSGIVTGISARGSSVAFTMDIGRDSFSSVPFILLAWSTDGGAGWGTTSHHPGAPAFESNVATCAGQAIAVYAVHIDPQRHFIGSSNRGLPWSTTTGVARRPDVACVANTDLVVAWFQRSDDGYMVRVRTGATAGDDLTPQSFWLGKGTPSRGLSVAATSDRVYVAWFQGNTLKLRRFRIASGSAHTLTSLGTSTVGTLTYASDPEIGADGSRVVLAYMHHADLKVRRSTDKGVSFGAARTLRDEPYPSEIGTAPTTVAVRGSLVAIGAVEIAGDPGGGGLSGRGLGYKSTNGGASYSRISGHSSGRLVATLVRQGGTYRYAEVWDESFTEQPSPGDVRYRRE
jgi:hypothetical protein